MTTSSMLKKVVVAALTIFGFVGVAYAGAKYTDPVYVGYNSGTEASGGYAQGALGDARASSDETQYIGCYVYVETGFTSPSVICQASDASGKLAYCYSNSALWASVVEAMTSNSFIVFGWTANTYVCNEITINNYSYYTPN